MTTPLAKHEWSDDDSKPIYDIISTCDEHSDSYVDADSCDDWGEHPSRRSPEQSEHDSDRDFIDDRPVTQADEHTNKIPCMLTSEEADFINEYRLATKLKLTTASLSVYHTDLIADAKTECRVSLERKTVPTYNPWPEYDSDDIESDVLCDSDVATCKSPLISATSPAGPITSTSIDTPPRRKFCPPDVPSPIPLRLRKRSSEYDLPVKSKRVFPCETLIPGKSGKDGRKWPCIPASSRVYFPANQQEAFDDSFKFRRHFGNWEVPQSSDAKKRKVSVDTSDWDKLSTM